MKELSILPVPILGDSNLYKSIKAGEYISQLVFLDILRDVADIQTDHILFLVIYQ